MIDLASPPALESTASSEPSEEDDELTDAELGESFDLTPPHPDEDAFDTEEASDLDIGADLDELEAEEDEDGSGLDIGDEADELLPVQDADLDERADDALETDSVLDEPLPDTMDWDRDDAEGPESTFAELGVPALPALAVEDDGENDLDPGPENLPTAWLTGDEPRPALCARAWQALNGAPSLEACSALAVADGVVVAASTDLFWFTPGTLTPLRLEAGSSRIASLALTKPGWEYAVCATASGRLLRRGRLAAASEELRAGRDLLSGAPGAESLELCQPGAAFPHTLLVRTARGVLFGSDDDALTFRRLTERRVRAVSPGGSPVFALSADGALLQSSDGGASFEAIELTATIRELASSETVLVTGCGSVVVLGDANVGVAVSADSGRTFQRIAGTWGVSAIAAGELDGRTRVWAALHDDSERTFIVEVDPLTGHAETIALLELASTEDEDATEGSRVVRLEWDAAQRRLWLAGGFGIRVYVPA